MTQAQRLFEEMEMEMEDDQLHLDPCSTPLSSCLSQIEVFNPFHEEMPK